MKDRRITIVATCTVVLFAPAGVAQTTNKFSEQISQSWHHFQNWSLGHVPPVPTPDPLVLAEPVLILAGNTCRILGQTGHAKSVEVEATGKLGVENSRMLHLHIAPTAPTGLTIDGLLYFRGIYGVPNVPATLLVEVDDLGRATQVIFTGSGVINAAAADDPGFPGSLYGPAQMVDPEPGADGDPIGIEITSGLTLKGAWDIVLSIDNDGLVLVDGDDIMDIHSPVTCDVIKKVWETLTGEGVFRLSHVDGEMLFGNRDDNQSEFSAELEVSAGLMHFYNEEGCPDRTSQLDMHDGRITVTGGTLLFDDGVFSENPGGATIDVSGGLLNSKGFGDSGLFVDTLVTITGGEFRTNHDVTFEELNVQPAITITGAGEFNMLGGVLFVRPDAEGKTPIIINGNEGVKSLECKWFLIQDSTLSIAGGEFHVVGDALQKSLLSSSTLTLSGGTLFLGGTFDGAAGSPITVSGGTLEIRGDNRFQGVPDFLQRGAFSFTGGKIKVKKDRVVRIE